MRIVAVVDSRRFVGAVEQTFLNVCEGLAERGHTVTALLPPRSPMIASLMSTRAQSTAVKKLPAIFTRAKKGKLGFFQMGALRKAIKRANPDVVVAYDMESWPALLQACKDKWPLAACPRLSPAHTVRGADLVIAQTGAARARIMRSSDVRGGVWVVPDSIEVKPREDRDRSSATTVIGALGRFEEDKGFDDLLDAAAILGQRDTEFQLILAGAGPHLPALRKRAKSLGLKVGPGKQLEFRGWINGRAEFYAGLDVFCLPSRRESFGFSLFEAWMYGVPVVASDPEGPAEFVRDGVDGLLVPRCSPEDLANALEYMTKSLSARRRLAEGGRGRLETDFTMEVVAELWETALEGFLTRRTPEEAGMDGSDMDRPHSEDLLHTDAPEAEEEAEEEEYEDDEEEAEEAEEEAVHAEPAAEPAADEADWPEEEEAAAPRTRKVVRRRVVRRKPA